MDAFRNLNSDLLQALSFPKFLDTHVDSGVSYFLSMWKSRANRVVAMHVPVMASFSMNESSIELQLAPTASLRAAEAFAAAEAVAAFVRGFHDGNGGLISSTTAAVTSAIYTTRAPLQLPEDLISNASTLPVEFVDRFRDLRRSDTPVQLAVNLSITGSETMNRMAMRNAHFCTSLDKFWDIKGYADGNPIDALANALPESTSRPGTLCILRCHLRQATIQRSTQSKVPTAQVYSTNRSSH